MGKTKDKTIPEGKLLKAIAELEEFAKGDALEGADPEGGLSTEGKPLSDEAPSGRGESTKKSRAAASSPFESGSGDDDDDSASSSGSSGDDDDDGDDDSSVSEAMSARRSPPPKGKTKGKGKTEKSVRKAERRSSSSSSAASSDAGSGAEKSFRRQAEGDEVVRKAIVVNDFLEALVDQLSLALHGVQTSIAKSLRKLEDTLTARIDERVSKSTTTQQEFNARLAKAVSAIGTTVQEDLLGMADAVKSLSDQPVSRPRARAVLSKSEVNQPPWAGAAGVDADQRLLDGTDERVAALSNLSQDAIGDGLFKLSARNQVDPQLIMAWEADRYNVEALPMQVRKALANELIK